MLGPSWVGWVAVTAWIVVIRPSAIPNRSCTTFASGARQFVVHDALDTTVCLAGSYAFSFTPITIVGTVSGVFVGALITTRLAPACTCFIAES